MPPTIDKLDTMKPGSSGSMVKRALSALVLIPVTLAAVHAGGPVFAGMVCLAGIFMLFEWARMVERRNLSKSFFALAAAAIAAMYFAATGAAFTGLGVCAAGGVIAFALAKRDARVGFWMALASVYLLMPCVALVWLRLDVEGGRALTFFLFAIVWAADTGAFVFGKVIGGPKISYALSPSKTWAGIGGGVIGGALMGVGAAIFAFGIGQLVVMALVGAALGAASVAGDLAESAFKRYFGLKDISGFIPGHGGLLDRLDGMIFATSAMTGGLILYMLFEKI